GGACALREGARAPPRAPPSRTAALAHRAHASPAAAGAGRSCGSARAGQQRRARGTAGARLTSLSNVGRIRASSMWASDTLRDIVSVYGYGAVALAAALEGIGIPVPGETMLVLASVYAGLTGHLSIVLVVVAAAGGAIAGDNAGYWIGRELGGRLLRHRTRRGVLNERRLRIGQYLFARHGGKVVYFARFLAVLRTLGAFLAGYNRMSWRRFVLFNGAGGSSWALAFGAAAYLLGNGIHRVLGPASIAGLIVAAAVVVAVAVLIHRRGHAWADEVLRAEREREQRQRTLADSASDRGSDPPPSARNN